MNFTLKQSCTYRTVLGKFAVVYARTLFFNISNFLKSRNHKCASFKPRPSDRNLSTQHIATLLGATCCVRLATVLRCVVTCWVLLAQVWKWPNLSQQHPTRRNMLQLGGQTHAKCCAQQCCDMLRWCVAIVWQGFKSSQEFNCPFILSKTSENCKNIAFRGRPAATVLQRLIVYQ